MSSSYLKLGLLLRWFTGNIGFHHVRHLNSLIPFYRLPDAMAAIPELQHPGVTTLRPRDRRLFPREPVGRRERTHDRLPRSGCVSWRALTNAEAPSRSRVAVTAVPVELESRRNV